MQEFPHALPFRQYLQHGWTVSFAFPFLDDGMSSSDGEGGALVARRASAKLSLPPETVATTTTMLISFRIRRSCRQPAWDSYLESSAAPIARPAAARSRPGVRGVVQVDLGGERAGWRGSSPAGWVARSVCHLRAPGRGRLLN